MDRRAGIRPGDWVIVGLIVAGHAADVPLIRRGHDTVSTCSRRWLWFLAAFAIHASRPGCRWDAWARVGRRYGHRLSPLLVPAARPHPAEAG